LGLQSHFAIQDGGKIILMSIEGKTNASIADELQIRPNTVGLRRHRFNECRLNGLLDLPRPGKPPKYDHDRRLAAHPNIAFHFTPASASWLNMVEIWFGIMTGKVLKAASFKGTDDLMKAINDFISVCNDSTEPFVWRKREVKGTQLKNTIVNLCN
jgi:hypothetical protein